MKVKCPTCNVKMEPYQREEIFPDGGIMINLRCPICDMEAVLSYFRERGEDDDEDESEMSYL